MAATVTAPQLAEDEQRLDLCGVSWRQYVTIADALPDWRGLKMIFLDGRLTFLTTSRRHVRYADRLGYLIHAVAHGSGILWEDSSSATYRLEEETAGVEGDKTYYFGEHAEVMKGPVDIDLTTQPPPDLAIEVEVTHPADVAMGVYCRLGVPEVWRFDVGHWKLTFWRRRDDGCYEAVPRSAALPVLEPGDVLGQLRLADELGSARWFAQLGGWVRGTLVPRLGAGA